MQCSIGGHFVCAATIGGSTTVLLIEPAWPGKGRMVWKGERGCNGSRREGVLVSTTCTNIFSVNFFVNFLLKSDIWILLIFLLVAYHSPLPGLLSEPKHGYLLMSKHELVLSWAFHRAQYICQVGGRDFLSVLRKLCSSDWDHSHALSTCPSKQTGTHLVTHE